LDEGGGERKHGKGDDIPPKRTRPKRRKLADRKGETKAAFTGEDSVFTKTEKEGGREKSSSAAGKRPKVELLSIEDRLGGKRFPDRDRPG